MADDKSFFRFILYKFSKNLPNDTPAKQLQVCFRKRCVVILLDTGQLSIRSLVKDNENDLILDDFSITSFYIASENTDAYQHSGKLQVAVISEKMHLLLLTMIDGKLITRIDIELLNGLPKDCMIDQLHSVGIVHYVNDCITVRINEHLLTHFKIKDNHMSLVSKMDLSQDQESSRSIKVLKSLIIGFDFKNKISCYSLEETELLWEIDLSKASIDIAGVQTWSIDDDITRLVFAMHSGDIVVLNIPLYCRANPQCLWIKKIAKKSKANGDQSYLETCQYGDIAWREKLLDLHSSDNGSHGELVQLSQKDVKSRKKNRPFSRVTGFGEKKKHMTMTMDNFADTYKVPERVQGFSVDGMSVSKTDLYIVYGYNEQSMIIRWNLITKQMLQCSLSHGDIVLLSEEPGSPHIIVTKTNIEGVLIQTDMNQEQFVSDMMAYGDACLADSLCHLNSWGRCSIPLHTLQVGLKHRQFDTVAFFLKSKEQVFTTTHASIVQRKNSPSSAPQFSHYESIDQLNPVISLLLEAVQDTLGDKHAKIFAKQILDISMDFLYELLLDGINVSESLTDSDEKMDLQIATEKLLEYIENTRKFVQNLENHFNDTGSKSDTVSNISDGASYHGDVIDNVDNIRPSTPMLDNPAIFSEWDHMDIETVIEDGIMKNIVPDLQLYLLQRGEYSRADYSQLKSYGSNIAVNYVKYGSMGKARDIFFKLGLSADDELWTLALSSTDLTVCNSIFEELEKSNLTEEHQSMIKFFKTLNELYPCRDFDQLKLCHRNIKDHEGRDVMRLKNLISQSSSQYDFIKVSRNLSIQPREDIESPIPYNEVLLEWIQHWDHRTRQMILIDVLINKPGADLSSISQDVVWDYLTMRNSVDTLVAWIHNTFSGNNGDSVNESSARNLGTVPAEFVNRTELCTHYSRNTICKAFAIHGVYSEECLQDFQLLLKQLGEVGGPLQLPHPHGDTTMINIGQFHHQIVQYCIQHNQPYFLWTYCSYFGLSLDSLLDGCQGDESQTWLPLFNQFIGIIGERNVQDCMYTGSLYNAMRVWNEDTSSVGFLLQSGHVLAALATLMYSQHKLTQVTFVTQQLEAFDGLSSELVEQAIQVYPKLHVTLFPASLVESPHIDVSIYQLLVGNAPFDPSKLFGWQNTNICAGEECSKDMPYFSQPLLVSQYGHVEQLRYNYYLKQGRPSFAFVTFLAEELKNGGPTIQSKRLSVAIGTSLWYGIKYFYNTQISSACVVFQELLGHNSLLLRTYIQVGTEILSYRNHAVTGTMDKRREQMKNNEHDVVDMLLQCVQTGKISAQTTLHALEAAILASVTRERLSVFETCQRWTIVILFCHLLRIPYSTVFLESCAESKQWLPFVWFSQIHQYPTDQLLSLLHKFPSSHLQEHLRYILVNADVRSSQAEEKKVQAKHRSERVAKDVRSNLYTRIGLMKDVDTDATSSSSEDDNSKSLHLPEDDDTDEDNTVAHVTSESSPGDVFSVIFAAQSSKIPWKSLLLHSITVRNCLFAELAACLEDSITLPCLIGWLVAMMDVTEHAQFLEDHGKLPWRYNLHTLDVVIDIYISKQWGSLLVTGFDIFQQSSPLLPFLQFYAEFTEKHNYKNCKLLLEEFKESVFQFHHESKHFKQTSVSDSDWLEKTTYRIIQYMLTCTSSLHEVSQLLKILDTECITLVFKNVDADFAKQSQMLICIEEGEVEKVNLYNLLSHNTHKFNEECLSIVNQLTDKHLYRLARRFADITGINSNHVTLTQVYYEKEKICHTDLWKLSSARFKFYHECTDKFKKYKIPADKVAEFFKTETELYSSPLERASLYQLCLSCLSQQDNTETDIWHTVYRSMWTNRIQARINVNQDDVTDINVFNSIFTDSNVHSKSNMKSELMYCGKMPHQSDVGEGLSPLEIPAVQYLINELLKQGKISEACRLSTEFSIYSQDLAILLTCIRLSMGNLCMDTLPPEMLHLLRTRPGDIHRQSIAAPVALLRNSSTISLMSNIQPVIDSVSEENEAKISAMECLLSHCESGRPTCIRIITAFKIASVLYIGYDDVVAGEDYFILRSLLKTTCSAKFRLAADFLGTSSLSPDQVAGFLSDAILQSYKVSLGDALGDRDLLFDPRENFADFHQIVRLCIEPSLLGNKLVDIAASLGEDHDNLDDKVLTLQTELLILGHECYTASCDMEGISNILRAARILTAHLQVAGEHQLMTRLLTGVGRYNEMTYIFDALQQNHKFELLLGKGKEKETKLKTAILDYLKRYHPSDTETYTMVALKFMMYREIAQLLEDNANKILESLQRKPFDNSVETQSMLQKCVQYLSEAAESYVKNSCLRHAQSCIRKARLVALQITYLPSSQQFINLTTKGANLLISDHPVFSEAFIISEAYQLKDNWTSALCNNVVNQGNMRYLQDFRSNIKLTPQLIEDVVDRYQQSSEKSPQAPNNIKKLLQYCKDVKVQYRVAKQLGLRDYTEELKKSDAKSYIMDFAKISA
ncbi:Spastic paraplegia 11 (autosomal recessive) [Mactra antiquata]